MKLFLQTDDAKFYMQVSDVDSPEGAGVATIVCEFRKEDWTLPFEQFAPRFLEPAIKQLKQIHGDLAKVNG